MDAKIILTNVRLSFPALFKPEAFGDSEPKYGASLLLDKTSDAGQIEALKKMMNDACRERWGQNIPRNLKACFRDGDEKDETKYSGYAHTMYVRATSKRRPAVVNRDRSPITEEDGILYAGCYVNAAIEIWSYHNSFGDGIGAWLQGIQFVRDGKPFGSNFNAESEFPSLEPGGATIESFTSHGDETDLPF